MWICCNEQCPAGKKRCPSGLLNHSLIGETAVLGVDIVFCLRWLQDVNYH